MLEFASNTDIEITVPYEYNGTTLTLTGFEYEVLDAAGTVVLPRQADPNFNTGNSSSVLAIPDSANTTTAKRDVRLLNCYLINTTGTYVVAQVYMLKGNQLVLTPLVDSFQTFTQAVLTRASMAEPQDFYDTLTDELKAVSLEESFIRLAKLQFKVGDTIIEDIKSLDLATFNALNSDFLTAIRKAQIAEANSIVENSPIMDKIRSGIISETIGESSMFFKQSGAPMTKTGLSHDAEDYINPWVYRGNTSSNVWRIARA